MGSSPRAERWWTRARGRSPWSRTARSEATSRAAAPSETWEEQAAVTVPPSRTGQGGHLLRGGVPAGALVHGDLAAGDGLAGEAAGVDGPDRAPVRAQGELLLLFAVDAPLGGDHLGTGELVDGPVAVAGAPAGAAEEGALGQAEGDGGLPGGEGDGDLGHVLHPAGDHQVLGAGEHGLRGEVDGLLGGAALPVDGDAGHLFGEARGQPAGAGDVAGLRSDRVQTAEDHVVHGGRVDPGALHQRGEHPRAQVGRVDRAEFSPAPPDRCADRFDDVGLGHGNSLCRKGALRTAIRVRRSRPGPSTGTGGRSPRGCACRRAGTRRRRPTRCRGRTGR